MKVSELSGALLDEWVARAEGYAVELRFRAEIGARVHVIVNGTHTSGVPHYSADWAHGGPIVEREGLTVRPLAQLETFRPGDHCWTAHYLHGMHAAYGRALLEAAMRAFIKSKFGDLVSQEVPA